MTGGRRWVWWAGVAYALIIAAVGSGLFRLYTGAYSRLDEAQGQRLLAVAGSLAEMADGQALLGYTLGDTTSNTYLARLSTRFAAVARTEDLSEITLTDPVDRRVILSTTSALVSGEPNDFWDLDPLAVESAVLGKAAATRLYDPGGADGLKQKSAHAPVLNYVADGSYVVAIITVSGSPDFFEALDDLKFAAYATGVIVLLVLIVMGVFLYRINLALTRYRASILRQENLAAMGRMTAGIAHEIRNPLGIIRGAGQHLQRVLDEHDISDEVVDFIPEEVDRLDHILSGYLTFGAAGDALSEEFDLARSLGRSVDLVRKELAGKGIEARDRSDWPPTPVRGDPRRLQQVMLNLLLNARDAMPGGGSIEIDLSVGDGRVTVTVSDEGCGLAAVDVDRIFEPFWTSKEKGSGLGLAMSRRIMEDMGGGLILRDRTDRSGAVAEFWSPLAN